MSSGDHPDTESPPDPIEKHLRTAELYAPQMTLPTLTSFDLKGGASCRALPVAPFPTARIQLPRILGMAVLSPD
jgi:hypothetical protein